MNMTTQDTDIAAALPPPRGKSGAFGWLRARLFSTPLNILITLLIVWLLLMGLPPLVEWALLKANFTASNAQECSAGQGGAAGVGGGLHGGLQMRRG